MKLTISRALNVLFVAIIALMFVFVFRESTWYYSKYDPNPVAYRGNTKQTPALRDLEKGLTQIKPDEHVYTQAQKVVARTEYYRLLLSAYLNQTLSERTIDFIGEIHQSPMSLVESDMVQVHRNRTKSFLLRSPARVLGIEGYSSEILTPDTLFAEFGSLTSQMSQEIQAETVNYVVEKTPVLRIGFSNQSRVVVGLEDKELHDFTILLIETMTYNTDKKLQSKYAELFNTLTLLRTEIAVARMNKVMRQRGLRFGVIVQGDMHRYQFLKLKELYRIPGKVESTIPKKDQDPITILEFIRRLQE